MQRAIDEPTIMAGNFSNLLSEVDRYSRQKISKDITELNNTINQMNTIDIWELLCTMATESTFSSSNETFTKIEHVVGHSIQV